MIIRIHTQYAGDSSLLILSFISSAFWPGPKGGKKAILPRQPRGPRASEEHEYVRQIVFDIRSSNH